MRSKKEMSKLEILNLQLLQQTDQVEAWVRDHKNQLLDSFCNNTELNDDDYDESMYMASSWALAQILNKQKENLYNEIDPEKLKKIVNKITWKDITFFLLSIFTKDIVDMLESIETMNEETEEEIDDEDDLFEDEEPIDEEEIIDIAEEEFDNLENEITDDDGYNYYELIALGCVLAAIADSNAKKKTPKKT